MGKVRLIAPLALLVCAVWVPYPTPAAAGLLNPPPRVFVAPKRLFQVEIPQGWGASVTKDTQGVQFMPDMGGDAHIWVRRIAVPQGASPRQLALQSIERRLSKMPRFKLLSKRNVTLGGRPAATVLGTFSHQGNIQYPRAVEEVFIVAGNEAFIVHFECFEPMATTYAPILNKMYNTFMPRPPGIGTAPFSDQDEANKFPEVDKLKF